MPRRIKGERRHGKGWEVYVRVNGELRTKTFPLHSTPAQRQSWRIALQHGAVPSLPREALGRDAVRWLQTVKHTADYPNKRTYMAHWLAKLGRSTPRDEITSARIATVLSDWLHEGYSPTTVRHHRTALKKLWEFCDGKAAANPVRDTPRPRDVAPEVRAVPIAHVQAVLEKLRGKTRARLRLMLATGLPHAQVMQLTEHSWDKERRMLRIGSRKKGRGSAGRQLPLSDVAEAALREFHQADAYGAFSQSAMHSAVHRACDALGLPRFRPYDIRHLFGFRVYALTGDLHTVARLLGHSDIRTAARYAAAAFDEVDRKVMEKL
jgi:integrase